MKKFLIPLLCSAILLLCGGCDLSDKVRIGTAAEGGNYYIFGSELNAIDSLESYNINIKRTAGSAANMRLLSENYLQMAVVQTDIIDDAWNGRRLIVKHDLLKTVVPEDDSLLVEEGKKHERHFSMYAPAVYQLVLAVGAGTVISYLLTMTGMTFPIYIGAMIVAALMRNIGEYTGKITIHMGEINDLGGICLSLFLGIAMITLKLWQLADLALPLIIMLGGQVLLMFLYSYFVVYRIMGRDYDSAVLTAGMCGFGMGATPNAMANMQAICQRYAPSVKAYLLVPLIGSLFADFLNSITITFFINML